MNEHKIDDFRNFEYTNAVRKKTSVKDTEDYGDALRQFKAGVFQVLAHPTRIHIIECLREGEQSVSAILDHIAVEPANASQHLSVLRSKGLVVSRKEGNQVFYGLRDPMLIEVLDAMRAYFRAHLEEAVAMLQGLDQ